MARLSRDAGRSASAVEPWQASFRKLWFGQGLAQLAAQIVMLVLPLVAALTLHATPQQMGLLGAIQFLPVLLLTLLAGAWMEGRRRRPILLVANLGRAALLALVPLCSAWGMLSMEALYAITFGFGALTAVFNVAYQAYMPDLVPGEGILAANSKAEATFSLAQVAGPGLAGMLSGAIGAPNAAAAAVVAYLLASLGVALIRHRERVPVGPGGRALPRVAAGLRFVFATPTLRALMLQSAWFNLFEQAVLTLYVLYGTRQLGFEPGLLGLTMALGAVGAVVGSLSARRLGGRYGAARMLVLSMGAASFGPLLIPAVRTSGPGSEAGVTFAFFLYGFGLSMFNVHSISLRQVITPRSFMARVVASYRFTSFGTIPLGSLVGGFLGSGLGLRTGLVVSAAALLAGWAVFAWHFPRAHAALPPRSPD